MSSFVWGAETVLCPCHGLRGLTRLETPEGAQSPVQGEDYG
mgnify:CR=1 FL=1